MLSTLSKMLDTSKLKLKGMCLIHFNLNKIVYPSMFIVYVTLTSLYLIGDVSII